MKPERNVMTCSTACKHKIKKHTHTSSSLTLSLLRKGELPQPYIHIFMNTSDNGPDQQAVRNGIHTMFSTRNDLSFALFFAECVPHPEWFGLSCLTC